MSIFFDETYKEGFIIGYCVSCLKALINFKINGINLDKKKIKEFFPYIEKLNLEEFKLELNNLKNSDYDDFFYKYEELFKTSLIYKAAEEDSEINLKKKHKENKINEIIAALKEINEDIEENNTGLVFNILFKYDISNIYKKDSIIPIIINDDKTITRIKLANTFMSIKESSLEVIKDNLIKKENNGNFIEYRFGRAIVQFSNISDYAIYKIIPVNIDKAWIIVNNERLKDEESLKYLDVDKYNRLI